MKEMVDECGSMRNVIVVPKLMRQKILILAHEHNGHLGSKKIKEIMHMNFTWPTSSRDIANHCRACTVCQKFPSSGQRKHI